MSQKTKPKSRQIRLVIFGALAITFFIVVAYKFRFAEFKFSMLEFMFLLLGMFSLAVALMVWQVLLPLFGSFKNLKTALPRKRVK